MDERVRFYADEHVSGAVVQGLRLHGVDVLTTAEAGMIGASDEEQVVFAIAEGRVLYTQDADYLRLHRAGVTHAGIAYAKQGKPIGEVVRGLLLVYDLLDAKSMAGAVEFI